MDDLRRYPRGMTTNDLMNSGGIPFTVDSIGPESKHFIHAAFLRDVVPDHYWNRQMGWIDMSAQMALDARMLAEMAERIGRANDDCRVIAVRALDGTRPVLVSTSRHVASPVIDVTDECWDAAAKTLSGVSKTVPGEAYELRIWVPDGCRCTSADGGTVRQTGSELRVSFENPGETLVWKLAF